MSDLKFGHILSCANALPSKAQITLAHKEAESPFHNSTLGKTRKIWRLQKQENISNLMGYSLLDALKLLGMNIKEIDYVIVSLIWPRDMLNTESLLFAKKVGLTCPVICINAGTSGGLAALELASGLLTQGQYQNIAIIAGCCYSHYFSADDAVQALASDGAACMIVSSDDGAEIIGFHNISTANFPTLQVDGNSRDSVVYYPKASGMYLVNHFSKTMKRLCTELCAKSNIELSDIKKFHIYDPVSWVANDCAKTFPIDEQDIMTIYDKYGSLGNAQNLFGFVSIVNESPPEEGDHILLASFAPGVQSVSVLLRFRPVPVTVALYDL